jgi:hypothetical protein
MTSKRERSRDDELHGVNIRQLRQLHGHGAKLAAWVPGARKSPQSLDRGLPCLIASHWYGFVIE